MRSRSSQAQSIPLSPTGSASQDGAFERWSRLAVLPGHRHDLGGDAHPGRFLSGASLDGVVSLRPGQPAGVARLRPGRYGLEPASMRSVLIDVVAGQTYAIELAGLGGYRGGYTLAISTTSGDGFGTTIADATPLNLGSQATTVDGLVDAPGGGDVFRVVAPSTGQLTVPEDAAQGSGLDSFLVVYNDSGLQIAVNDDSGGTLNSLVDVPVRGGDTYFIQAGGYGVSTGAFVLTIQPTTPIVDDYSGFATAHPIGLLPDGSGTQSGTIIAGLGGDRHGGRMPGGRDDQPLRVPGAGLGIDDGPARDGPGGCSGHCPEHLHRAEWRGYPDCRRRPRGLDKGGGSGDSPTFTFAVTAGQVYFLEVAPRRACRSIDELRIHAQFPDRGGGWGPRSRGLRECRPDHGGPVDGGLRRGGQRRRRSRPPRRRRSTPCWRSRSSRPSPAAGRTRIT